MKRTRSAASSPGVALFPFLAVLLCTMGALILLLVVIARQARLQAAELRETPSDLVAEADGDADAERAELEWRIEQLRQARQKTLERMAEARLELSHLEDHARRLVDQLESIDDGALSLDDVAAARGRERARIEADLAAVRAQIDALRREIEQARQSLSQREPAYAIIPYEGPSHTRRRPIYIECRDDAIVIQPEGIQLYVADFEGSLGPGNVLASALRAAQEYSLLVAPGEPGSTAQPYPLLIVRPEGTIAYYVARAAMSSWNSEFGYELVESDMKLAYPPPDPNLAELMARAVDEARRRQAVLAAAAPRTVLDRGRPVYRAATSRGGAVLDGGDDRGFGIARGASRFQPERSSFGGAGGGLGDRDGRGSSAYPTELKPAPEGAPHAPGAGGVAEGSAPGEDGEVAAGERGFGSQAPAQGIGGSTAVEHGPNASAIAGAAASSNPSSIYPSTAPRAAGASDGLQPSQSNGSFDAAFGESPQSDDAGGAPRGNSTTAGAGSPSDYRASDTAAGAGSSMSAQGSPGSQPGTGSFSLNAPIGAGAKQSLAARRGRDWGLPDAARGAIPITRPVQVDCYSDHLTVYASGPSSPNKVIPLEGSTEESVDALVSAVWEQIGTWGIAGNRMYWKPVLSFHVVDNGDARFRDLEQLLDGSGIEVRRTGGSAR